MSDKGDCRTAPATPGLLKCQEEGDFLGLAGLLLENVL